MKQRSTKSKSLPRKVITVLVATVIIAGVSVIIHLGNQQFSLLTNLVTQRPVGSITASPSPCIIENGEQYCKSTITWTTADVNFPKVHVRIKEGNRLFACRSSNQVDAIQNTGKWIPKSGLTFEVYPAQSCHPQSILGQKLATVTVKGTIQVTDTPLCTDTGEPMDHVDPSFLGIIVNEIHTGVNYRLVSERLAAANVDHIHRVISWKVVERTNGEYDWVGEADSTQNYDALFGQFAEDGLGIYATLTDYPTWIEREDQYEDFDNVLPEWEDFVRETVRHYGPQGKNIIHNWEIWLEPNAGATAVGTPDEYVQLLNAAKAIIEVEDPNAMVWAGQLTLPQKEETYMPYVKAILDNGNFDGFSIHTFHDTTEQMVNGKNGTYGVKRFRELLDDHQRHGSEVPLGVSAAQIWDTGWVPANGQVHCPYRDPETLEKHAEILTNMYACLANAGAVHVSTYKATDRNLALWAPNICPNDMEISGVLGTNKQEDPDDGQMYARKPVYWTLKNIGDYLHEFIK